MFTVLVSLTALLVAGVAAFFSVKGIGMLFAGAMIETMIMAATLEISKLVVVSFCYRFWNQTPKLLRLYLLVAIVTLMGITSLGIYGFLSAAYQKSASEYGIFTQQVSLLEKQKEYIQKDLSIVDDRNNTINESRKLQEERLNKSTITTSATSSQLSQSRRIQENTMKLIKESSQELETCKKDRIDLLTKIKEFDMKIMELKETSKHSKDIITFQFIADAIGWELNRVVKWFILIIIIVFDPLAVGLVLAYNIIVCGKVVKEQRKIETDKTGSNIKGFDDLKNYVHETWEDRIEKTEELPEKIKEYGEPAAKDVVKMSDADVHDIVEDNCVISPNTLNDVTENELRNVFIEKPIEVIKHIEPSKEVRKKTDQELYQEIQSALDKSRQFGK